MRRNIAKSLLVIAVAVVSCAGVASADMSHVTFSLPSLGVDPSSVQDFEVEILLVDWSYSYQNDSWARIDDFRIDGDIADFTGGDWGGFAEDIPWGSPIVGASIGDWAYPGNPYLYIAERSDTPETIVYKDFNIAGALSFDVEVALADGDQLVLRLLDLSGAPLGGSLTPGYGDVIVFDAEGMHAVPAPAAVLLGLLGFGSAGLGLRTRLARSKS